MNNKPPDLCAAIVKNGYAIDSSSCCGRLTRIETIGKHSYTWVPAETPLFEIHCQAGKLVRRPNHGLQPTPLSRPCITAPFGCVGSFELSASTQKPRGG